MGGETLKVATSLALLSALAFAHSDIRSAHADTFGTGANTFDIEFVIIGNPGNAADTTGNPNPAGKVDYVYRIGKFEISEQMIDKANALGGLSITKDSGGADKPATSISWNEAARFINWLNTSTGSLPAYKFAIQPGEAGYNANANIELWTTSDAGYDPTNLYRNRSARYFLPSVDEWYKAAYYDPAGVYYDYPTGSNSVPTAVASGTAAGTAVYNGQAGPTDIKLAGGLSPYSTMGQGGNVYEWEETDSDLLNGPSMTSATRGARGGFWSVTSFALRSISRPSGNPTDELFNQGFRVASTIPEPSTALLAIVGFGLFLARRGQHSRESAQSPARTAPYRRQATFPFVLVLIAAFIGVDTESSRAVAAPILGNLPSNDLEGSPILFAGGAGRQKAMVFTTGNTPYTVDEVVLRLDGYVSATDVPSVGIFLDNGSGTNTGAQVGNTLIAPVSTTNAFDNFSFLPNGRLFLAANTRYWLLVDATAGSFGWWGSSPAAIPTGPGATFNFARNTLNDGLIYNNSSALNAFQINGTPVPEPSAFILGAMGLGLLFARQRHRTAVFTLVLMSTLVGLNANSARADIAVAWGNNGQGQLGNGTLGGVNPTPAAVSVLNSDVTAVAAGHQFNLAVQDGALYAWGLNRHGQLGNGTKLTEFPEAVATPGPVSGLTSGVTDFSAGTVHGLAVVNGAAYAWGNNSFGLLGDGTTTERLTPVPVVGLTSGVTHVAGSSSGSEHSLAIQNGAVFAWGENSGGKLGDGSAVAYSTTPVPVTGLTSGATAIASGRHHSLAIVGGAAYAWGGNASGQLGDGTNTNRSTPVPVVGLSSGVTDIAAGDFHNLAVVDGRVYAWGLNSSGSLGFPGFGRNTPVLVDPTKVHDIVAVAAGEHSSFALSRDGSMWVWGNNNSGQLGFAPNILINPPQQVLPPAGYKFTSIDAGVLHAVATLRAIPEPSTLLLITTSALLLIGQRKRT
jgi:alpha-tubulin suppressor-like RCC1 family protein